MGGASGRGQSSASPSVPVALASQLVRAAWERTGWGVRSVGPYIPMLVMRIHDHRIGLARYHLLARPVRLYGMFLYLHLRNLQFYSYLLNARSNMYSPKHFLYNKPGQESEANRVHQSISVPFSVFSGALSSLVLNISRNGVSISSLCHSQRDSPSTYGVIQSILSRNLAGVSCSHAQGLTDCQTRGLERNFPQV